MTTHFTHPVGSSVQHSKYLSSSSGMDLTDPADDYVPPLPSPIITSSFSSNHDEDNMEDDAVEVALKRKVVKSNARKLMKKFILSQKFSTHCF